MLIKNIFYSKPFLAIQKLCPKDIRFGERQEVSERVDRIDNESDSGLYWRCTRPHMLGLRRRQR